MNAIVTGAAGFVASHVVDALLLRGDRVFAVDNLLTGSQQNLGNALGHSNFSLLIADVAHDGEAMWSGSADRQAATMPSFTWRRRQAHETIRNSPLKPWR